MWKIKIAMLYDFSNIPFTKCLCNSEYYLSELSLPQLSILQTNNNKLPTSKIIFARYRNFMTPCDMTETELVLHLITKCAETLTHQYRILYTG